ncbi:MAG: O-antigen ligase family protein [Armatimonadota bacterium]|nr:O-antigen ligase family protein [bacterium]
MLDNQNLTEPGKWTPERIALVTRNTTIVVVAGILLGVFAVAANLYYVAAVVGAALLVAIVAWQFEAALVIYVIVAFVPWGRTPDLAMGGSGAGKGVYISEIMLCFLLVVWLGRYLLGALPKQRISSGYYIPIAIYLAYSLLNVVNSYLFWDPHVNRIYQHPMVNIVELVLRFLSAGALVMVATSVSSRKWLRYITIAMMVPGLYNMLNASIGGPIPICAPWWPLVAVFPVGYMWATAMQSGASRWHKVIAILGVMLAIFTIFYRSVSWVSGWFCLFVCLGTITALHSRRFFVLLLMVILIVTFTAWPFIHKNVVIGSQEEGDYNRFALMADAWKYATTFPLGVGLGNYRTYNSFYYSQKWGSMVFTSAHGTYSQHLAEMGIPGFILLIMILGSGFTWVLREYRRKNDRFLLAILGQMAGISAAAFIGDYIIPTYHNGGLTTFSTTVYSWLIWGLAIAYVRISKVAE